MSTSQDASVPRRTKAPSASTGRLPTALPAEPAALRDATAQQADDGQVFVARTNDGAGVHSVDVEHADEWGFADTAFRLEDDGAVVLTGARYGLCGSRLTQLLPWVERTMGIEVPRTPLATRDRAPQVPPARLHPAFITAARALLGEAHVDTGDRHRLRHGHGHTQEEMYGIKRGVVPRLPDAVVFPDSAREVEALVALARQHNVCLVPFGGGTNVTEALRCPEDDPRTIVSVNTRRLDRILWIDEANGMARIEAGVVGRHLVKALAARGFTLGHEPDSIEFSTLGGWIATHASGMKKNKYGNIEDLVLDMTVVTSEGTTHSSHVGPRQSVGVDVERCLFGSEGTLGIVTSAIVKLSPLPEATRYGSLLFPNFEAGVDFMYQLTRARLQPASVRLVDNAQFQLSLALKEEKHGLAQLKSRAEKLFVTGVKGFVPSEMVACTLVFEGSAAEVAQQQKQVEALAKRHGGIAAGSDNGERGYQLTYSIAYIRDFVMKHGILAESFETSLPWTQIVDMVRRVKARIAREHRAHNLPGRPLVTARVTQVYDTGAAVYFYFATSFAGVDAPSETYAAIERAAREEVLAAGGSLSHHHGVGKLRQPFLSQVMGKPALAMRAAVKRALDPTNVFGVANGPVAP